MAWRWILVCSLLISGCGQEPDPQAMLDAAETGDLALLDKLLEVTPADQRDQCFWTPLMKAALNGHAQVVARLLEAGVDVNATDKGGYSALMLAASNNHAEIVAFLAANGANINQVELTNGWTALLWAAKQGHAETVAFLLQQGADITAADSDGATALSWAEENGHTQVVALFHKTP